MMQSTPTSTQARRQQVDSSKQFLELVQEDEEPAGEGKMDRAYKPLREEGSQVGARQHNKNRKDPPGDLDVSTSNPSVQIFNVEPSDDPFDKESTTKESSEASWFERLLQEKRQSETDVMKDLMQSAASKMDAFPDTQDNVDKTKNEEEKGGPRKKMQSPPRQSKKKATSTDISAVTEKVANKASSTSTGSQERKQKKQSSASPPASPTRTPKSKKKERSAKGPIDPPPISPPRTPKRSKRKEDVLLTSVHLKEHDESTERSEMSEITTPKALLSKKQASTVVKSPATHQHETPITPTEDLTDSPSLYTTSPDPDASPIRLMQQSAVPAIPNLNQSFPKLADLSEPEVFAIALPPGASGLSFKGSKHPTISSVKATSPLSGIVEPGLRIVGLHLPANEQTWAHLPAKEVQHALRDSARQKMRLLWLVRAASDEIYQIVKEECTQSTLATMSKEWKSNQGRPHVVALSDYKALISLPPSDLGLTLLGDPPLVYSINESSPLRDEIKPRTLYVTSVYCAETGDQWEGLDAHHLAETLRSTSQQQGRILVVTTEMPTEASSDYFASEEEKEGPLREVRPGDVERNISNRTSSDLDRDASNRTPPQQSSRSVRFPRNPTKHILVKSGWQCRGLFGRSKTRSISFHGTSMDETLAQAVQHHLDNIVVSKKNTRNRQKIERCHSREGLPIAFTATMKSKLEMNQADDALVAVMDAMASQGWNLNASFADVPPHSGRGECEKFIFTK